MTNSMIVSGIVNVLKQDLFNGSAPHAGLWAEQLVRLAPEDPEAVKAIAQYLGASDFSVTCLTQMDQEVVGPVVVNMLQSGSKKTNAAMFKKHAARVLAHFAQDDPDLISVLCEMWDGDGDTPEAVTVNTVVLDTIFVAEEGQEEMVWLVVRGGVQSGDPSVRLAAVQAIARLLSQQ